MGTLVDAIKRRQNADIQPGFQAFRGKSLAALREALTHIGDAGELRIWNTMREDGLRDAWWQVVPLGYDTADVSPANGDPPSGNESHPCPPLC